MGELLIQQRSIVVPGEIVARGMDYLPAQGVYRDGDVLVSSYVGMADVQGRLVKVIPLRGKYVPKEGDVVIGKVIEMTFSNWFININCANDAVLSSRETPEFVEKGADLSHYYTYGDYLVAKISKVTRSAIDLTMRGGYGLRKLGPGRLLNVNPSKVPRIIGKQGSMISLIKEKTHTNIIVGQNGTVWIYGEPEMELVATEIIQHISQEAHKEGLTDKVSKLLEERTAGFVPTRPSFEEHQHGEHHEN